MLNQISSKVNVKEYVSLETSNLTIYFMAQTLTGPMKVLQMPFRGSEPKGFHHWGIFLKSLF